MTEALHTKHCTPCEGGTEPLDTARIQSLLKKIEDHWQVEEGQILVAEFAFKNYYETTAFVNAVAWIAHQEDHHPDISFGYKDCTVRYTTHAINGLSDNDFICAAKIDALLS
ncbi:MAG: 4a-hydroxytetrahydrobiopterin dehydratase [Salinisphaeraceae bacterium]|nr:4a-hydroxytetrahydrobiopterin dehydratase [Salinisphaeraceae bacterium]